MSTADLDKGQLFAGRYRIVRRMAAGGMGSVYEVVHVETDRRRALKVMLPELVASPDLRARFKREARVTANVRSEHIVEVFDAGVDEATGMPFLVMELLEGQDLARRVERTGALGAAEIVTLLMQTAMALDKTHAERIVHRDLKPENLFLTRRDDGTPRVKILDFGISKVVSEASTKGAATRSLGTPLYMAPEQFAGESVQPATDVYALGMIAYTLLAGEPYRQEESDATENVFAFATRAMRGPIEVPTSRATRRGRSLPQAFDAWFARATHPDPSQRHAPATNAVAALAEALGVQHLVPVGPIARAAEAAPPTVPAGAEPVARAAGATGLDASIDARPARAGSSRAARLVPVLVGGAAVVVLALVVTAAVLLARRASSPAAGTSRPAPSPSASALLPSTSSATTVSAARDSASSAPSRETLPEPSSSHARAPVPAPSPALPPAPTGRNDPLKLSPAASPSAPPLVPTPHSALPTPAASKAKHTRD
jgi:serine/threonine-protein kinase